MAEKSEYWNCLVMPKMRNDRDSPLWEIAIFVRRMASYLCFTIMIALSCITGLLWGNRLPPKDIKRTLVISLKHIGDVVLMTPIFRALRQGFPQAHITVIIGSWSEQILSGNYYIDELLIYNSSSQTRVLQDRNNFFQKLKFFRELKRKRFDLAIDPHGSLESVLLAFLSRAKYRLGFDINGRGFLHTIKVRLTKRDRRSQHIIEQNLTLVKALGIEPQDKRPFIFIEEKHRQFIRRFLSEHGVTQENVLVGLHVGASCPSKMWSKERFAQVGDRLAEKYGTRIVLTGIDAERQFTDEVSRLMRHKPINAAGTTTIRQLAALLEICDLFITNDSGPMHIAVAVGTPVIDIHAGTDNYEIWGPHGDNNIVLWRDVPCRPCHKPVCNNHLCMDLISEAEVLQEAEKLLTKLVQKGKVNTSNGT